MADPRGQYFIPVATGADAASTLNVGFSAPKRIYKTANLTILGVQEVTSANAGKVRMDARLGDFGVPRLKCSTEKYGTAPNEKRFNFSVYCAPDKVDDLLKEVPSTFTVEAPGTTASLQVVSVRIPRRRIYV